MLPGCAVHLPGVSGSRPLAGLCGVLQVVGMHRRMVLESRRFLYAHSTRGNPHEYVREWQAMARSAAGRGRDPVTLDVAELDSYIDLPGALSEPYEVVTLAGHGSDLGLLKSVAPQARDRFAAALAELLVATCPGAMIVLLACNTSAIGVELALRGARAVAVEGLVDSHALPTFLHGYITSLLLGQSSYAAYENGCRLMDFEHWNDTQAMRWFGPEDVEGGIHGV